MGGRPISKAARMQPIKMRSDMVNVFDSAILSSLFPLQNAVRRVRHRHNSHKIRPLR